VPINIPMVMPSWYRKYNNTSKVLGVSSVNLLTAVNIKISALKKKTNPLVMPLRLVNFKITKLITVTEIANTVRNPVFIPKIKKSEEVNSAGLFADRLDRLIFSGEANRGTLKIAFIKNKKNIVKETVLTRFCKRGNRTRIALPRIIPWNNPIPKALKTAIS
jgi:hypothetical protein